MFQNDEGVRFEYNTEDQLIAAINEHGIACRYKLDALGRKLSEMRFDGSRRQYFWDAADRILAVVEASGKRRAYEYDDAGNVKKLAFSDGALLEFEYGPGRRLLAARTGQTEVRYEHDLLGRILAEVVSGDRVESEYSARGDRTALRTSLGYQVSSAWSVGGSVSSMRFGATRPDEVRFEREVGGFNVRLLMPGALALERRFDDLFRPTVQRTLRRSNDQWQALADLKYTWRGPDQLIRIEDAAGVTDYSYDGRGRPSLESKNRAIRTRVADAVGNIYYDANQTDRRYAPGGRLLECESMRFDYDEDGFLVKRSDPDGRTWVYAWQGGRLVEVSRSDGLVMRCQYDAFARRTRKTVLRRDPAGAEQVIDDTQFVWDGHYLIHEISTVRGAISWYWEPNSLNILAKEHNGNRYAVVCDHLGTPTEMYDESGRAVWKMKLDLQGRPDFLLGDAHDCPWRYPNGYDDPEVDLMYLRFRYLARTGVFISPDPLGMLGGFELYSYVADPLTSLDPLGLHTVYPRLNGQPVRNPNLGNQPLWPNIHGSGDAGMAPSGLGREGDSENLLLEHLRENNPEGLQGGLLEIESVQRGKYGALPPCEFCSPGLQQIADEFDTMIIYRTTKGKGSLRVVLKELIFRRGAPVQEKTGCGT